MKIPDNKIRSVNDYFHLNLDDLYTENEVESFFWFLLEAVFQIRKMDFMMDPQLRINEAELPRFIGFVKRLMKFEPVQYIAGETEFMGRPFKVSPAVLIPRPETEELVAWTVEELKHIGAPEIIDIGTGSGCIAISLKSDLPHSKVTGIDIQEEALKMAKRNALVNKVEVAFQKQDALQLGAEIEKYDVVISNPPYVLDSEKELMQSNVLDYEPHTALFVADSEPLLFYESIAKWAIHALKSGGKLFFEINERYASETVEMMGKLGFEDLKEKNDIFEKPRMVMGLKR